VCESGGFVVCKFDFPTVVIDIKCNDLICYCEIILSGSTAMTWCTLSACASLSVHIVVELKDVNGRPLQLQFLCAKGHTTGKCWWRLQCVCYSTQVNSAQHNIPVKLFDKVDRINISGIKFRVWFCQSLYMYQRKMDFRELMCLFLFCVASKFSCGLHWELDIYLFF
jgi:hypothetical protein